MSSSVVREILYPYISAYVDNELSSTDRSAIEKHLKVCAYCANERFQIEQMKNRLRNEFTYSYHYGLKETIKNKIEEISESDVEITNVEKNRFSWHWASYIVPPVVTAAVGALLVLALLPEYTSKESIMEEEIVSAHVRSLMENNLTHIESDGTDLVQPWFNSKVDFVAQPTDLDEDGFYLKGGRLDYINKHHAASIIYETGDHIINLFIFPTNEANMASFKTFENRGYNIVKWANNGLEYCAISDLNMKELNRFAQTYKNKALLLN